MIHLQDGWRALQDLIAVGGFVVVILLAMSVLSGALVLWKLWQHHLLGVGRHAALAAALDLWSQGATAQTAARLRGAPGLAGLGSRALALPGADRAAARDLLRALADDRMGKVCSGFRALDAVAQLGPLLGLFGTVLGMIEAFQAMQGAGAAVDPGVLAGGIWTALLTTAVGLAVAMTTTALLTWLEARAAAEQQMADLMIETLCAPALPPVGAPVPGTWAGLAHA
jgi:biopolymer transport protein ExbB